MIAPRDETPVLVLDETTVLVVDDHPDSVDILACALELAGAEVRTAKSSHEAIAILENGWTPQVVLLDIAMPRIDGYDLLAAIRCEPRLMAVPAVAITAHARDADRTRAREAGFSELLAKPLDVRVVLEVVARLASRPATAPTSSSNSLP
jgi:diguanylate cyclase